MPRGHIFLFKPKILKKNFLIVCHCFYYESHDHRSCGPSVVAAAVGVSVVEDVGVVAVVVVGDAALFALFAISVFVRVERMNEEDEGAEVPSDFLCASQDVEIVLVTGL